MHTGQTALRTDFSGPAPAPGASGAAAEAYFLGLAHARELRWIQAAEAYEAAVAAAPDDSVIWLNLAHARLKLEDLERGAAAASRAVALDPGSALGLTIAAQCFARAGRYQELVALFLSVDMQAIGDTGLHLQLSQALCRLGRLEESIQVLLDILRRNPRCAEAFAQLGNVFQLVKLPEEARESFRNAIALGAAPVQMMSAIVFTSLEASRWETLEQDVAALNGLVAAKRGQPVPFYSLVLAWTRQQQLAASRAYADRIFADITPLASRAAHAREAKIRVGYVSSDFHEHATAYLITQMLELHDRDRFSIHAYSYGVDDASMMRRRIQAAIGGNFVEANRMSAHALAARVRSDAIDILIDLKGYTLYARNEVFAYRAAPVQVNFLGFPGSLGSSHYDYVIGDPIVTPLEHADGFIEKIAQLPNCYQPNDGLRPTAVQADRARWQLPAAAFVFCCFNASYKITAQVFDRWCHLLRQIDDAVLWLFESNPQARKNLLAQARQRGVESGRIFWASPLQPSEHMVRIGAADLFLDTLPINAHTTASDALWAGVPVLTVLG
ncbi:MAG TPA: tetratricopeptide repeat protein, partial [Burkholderiaceae bacterium]|nr:tetratricopeptide repeat protein [Burkholderiaceae bacterium]